MKKISRLTIGLFMLLSLSFTFNSCEVLQQVADMQRLALCKFDLDGVDNINLGGIQLKQGMDRSDLTAVQIIQLTSSVLAKELPLKLNILVDVENPNDKPAALSSMDFSFNVDGRELIAGKVDKNQEIGAGKTVRVPVPVEVDLFKVFSGESADFISNLGFKLTGGSSEAVDLLFKVKPYINVGGSQLAYPGFIELKHTL